MQNYRDAIRAAHQAGHSTRQIAAAIGVSHVSIVQMLNRHQ
jgi:IS30 family transposase